MGIVRELYGSIGEHLINSLLVSVMGVVEYDGQLLSRNGYLFKDIVIPALPTSTRLVEIDHLLIYPGGVVSIETKNVGGLVLVPSEHESDDWTVVSSDRGGVGERKMGSPTRQNRAHVEALREHLWRDLEWLPVFGAVVMIRVTSGGWSSARVDGCPQGVFVDPFEMMDDLMQRPPVLDAGEMHRLATLFQKYYLRRGELGRVHLGQVMKKHG